MYTYNLYTFIHIHYVCIRKKNSRTVVHCAYFVFTMFSVYELISEGSLVF